MRATTVPSRPLQPRLLGKLLPRPLERELGLAALRAALAREAMAPDIDPVPRPAPSDVVHRDIVVLQPLQLLVEAEDGAFGGPMDVAGAADAGHVGFAGVVPVRRGGRRGGREEGCGVHVAGATAAGVQAGGRGRDGGVGFGEADGGHWDGVVRWLRWREMGAEWFWCEVIDSDVGTVEDRGP